MQKRGLFALAAIATVTVSGLAISVMGQAQKDSATHSDVIVRSGDLKWTPIIKGTDLAVVSGDPAKAGGLYVVRLRIADGARIPPHWHPEDENVTVLKGTFLVGAGETYDANKLRAMGTGNFMAVPKEMRHFGTCKGETIVQVHGVGPFQVNWVNPSEVIPPNVKK